MADESKSKADLIALFPDNSTGAIDEQAMRDLVVSCFGEFASILIVDGVTAQAITGTPQKMTHWTANGPSLGIVPDYVNDEVVISIDGVYEASGFFIFGGSANKTVVFGLYVDTGSGFVDSGAPKILRKLSAGGDVGSASMTFHAAANVGDKLAVFVWSSDGGIVISMQQTALTFKRIG